MGDDLPTDEELERLQWTTLLFYLHETNPDNGLVRDKTDPAAPSSIAAVGLALANLCSPTSSRTCGSTSAASATPSCASARATTSRTAGRRPSCSRRTRCR